ncbi:hypothetical protein QBC44DRAFT_362004 [Cladorrhinum sp. PSN332]|nr:hypothetical protein QBC44DRAFT_362004 [Cladorrhinum sp. PSN332]
MVLGIGAADGVNGNLLVGQDQISTAEALSNIWLIQPISGRGTFHVWNARSGNVWALGRSDGCVRVEICQPDGSANQEWKFCPTESREDGRLWYRIDSDVQPAEHTLNLWPTSQGNNWCTGDKELLGVFSSLWKGATWQHWELEPVTYTDLCRILHTQTRGDLQCDSQSLTLVAGPRITSSLLHIKLGLGTVFGKDVALDMGTFSRAMELQYAL